MTTLIVGANSKLLSVLDNFTDTEVVSHKNIPAQGNYETIYILSYSFSFKENIVLLDKISALSCPKTILLSSITSQINPKYKFKYPSIKRRCEVLALQRGFEVVRIGLVLETLLKKPKSGTFIVTSTSDLNTMIANNLSDCMEPKLLSFWEDGGDKYELIYLYILKKLGPFCFLIRPIDLILRY